MLKTDVRIDTKRSRFCVSSPGQVKAGGREGKGRKREGRKGERKRARETKKCSLLNYRVDVLLSSW